MSNVEKISQEPLSFDILPSSFDILPPTVMLAPVMNILGLETSGLAGSIALAVGGTVTQRELATEGRRHAQTLVAELHELLGDAGLKPKDVDAVAVSIGPGSFTGLRVGVVCAKTFAYATGCRVIAVDTLAAVAQQCPGAMLAALGKHASEPKSHAPPKLGACHPIKSLWIISDAQRGDFFTARYSRNSTGWQRDGELRIVHGPSWLPTLSADDVVAGPGTSRIKDEAGIAAIVIRDDWAARPMASAVIEIAKPRLIAGESDDLWTLAPLYIRPSAAEEKLAAKS